MLFCRRARACWRRFTHSILSVTAMHQKQDKQQNHQTFQQRSSLLRIKPSVEQLSTSSNSSCQMQQDFPLPTSSRARLAAVEAAGKGAARVELPLSLQDLLRKGRRLKRLSLAGFK